MNEIHTYVHHPRPPRPARILANWIATTILRSPWHRMRSNRLLLLTFTGRKSGKQFTTPLRYMQEGEIWLGRLRYTSCYEDKCAPALQRYFLKKMERSWSKSI